jgi:hypothetical protein
MQNYSETSEDQFYYRAKYLKYKQKYLELKGGGGKTAVDDSFLMPVNFGKIKVLNTVVLTGTRGTMVTLDTRNTYDMIHEYDNKYIITKVYNRENTKEEKKNSNEQIRISMENFNGSNTTTHTQFTVIRPMLRLVSVTGNEKKIQVTEDVTLVLAESSDSATFYKGFDYVIKHIRDDRYKITKTYDHSTKYNKDSVINIIISIKEANSFNSTKTNEIKTFEFVNVFTE